VVPSTPSGLTHIQIPLPVLESRTLSFQAKVLYGRLRLYAGASGRCNPSHETLAHNIGAGSARQIRRYLSELSDVGLVSWNRTRSSSEYAVHPPESLRADKNVLSDRTDSSGLVRTNSSDKKRLLNRSSGIEEDLDCALPKKRADDISLPRRVLNVSAEVRIALAKYWSGMKTPMARDYPPDEVVASVMHAANGRSPQWVIKELRHLHDVRGYRRGVEGGPKKWAWFACTIAEKAALADVREYIPDASEVWDYDGTRRVN